MKKPIQIVFLALLLLNGSAMALTLDEARAQGRVGETLSGYIAAISQDPQTQALVRQINQARSESYQRLADSNNIPLNEVAKIAGQKLVAQAQPGEYVRGINGRWLRKPEPSSR